jgi:hypothetical protein
MKSKYLHGVKILMLVPFLLATGCQPGGKREPRKIGNTRTRDLVQRIEAMKQVYHLSPSPAEMLSVIDVEGLSYDPQLLNPVSNSEQYLGSRSTTLALGIYATDLAYCALFGRHEETLDYLEAVQNLAGEVRLTGAVDDDLIQEARDNVDVMDSLVNISNRAFINMLFFCERNEMPGTVAMLTAGSFIESLYLAVNLAGSYGQAGYLLQDLSDQKYALQNLMEYAKSLEGEDENVSAVMEELAPIVKIYENIKTGGGSLKVTTQSEAAGDQPKKLVIGGSGDLNPPLTESEFEELKQETNRIRNRLVKG